MFYMNSNLFKQNLSNLFITKLKPNQFPSVNVYINNGFFLCFSLLPFYGFQF